MSIKAIKWAFNCFITPYEKLVLLILADHANDKNQCWPSFDHICRVSGFSKGRVTKSIKSLEANCLISIETRHNKLGYKLPRLYTLNLQNVQLTVKSVMRNYEQKDSNVKEAKSYHIGLGLPLPHRIRPSPTGWDLAYSYPVTSLVLPDRTTTPYIYIKPSLEPLPPISPPGGTGSLLQPIVHLDLLGDPISTEQKDPMGGFEEFWNAYPRKIAKAYCERIWKRKNMSKNLKLIIDDLKQRVDWDNPDNPFVPNPSTYLNQGRWLDEEKKNREKPKKQSLDEFLQQKYGNDPSTKGEEENADHETEQT